MFFNNEKLIVFLIDFGVERNFTSLLVSVIPVCNENVTFMFVMGSSLVLQTTPQ